MGDPESLILLAPQVGLEPTTDGLINQGSYYLMDDWIKAVTAALSFPLVFTLTEPTSLRSAIRVRVRTPDHCGSPASDRASAHAPQ